MTAEPTTDIALSNHDFTLPGRSHVQATLQQVEEFRALVHSELREGPDYGTIPGTSKPTLLKPGAEKIAKLLGLADTYEITDKTAEWEMGLFQYEVRCSLVSIRTGQIVAQGVGECNSYESKYRYREAKRKCPECGVEAIIKGKVEYGGGWVCFGKIGGCGAKWGDGASVIESQKIGRVLNEDPADQVNTILKMAKKRSLIDASLSVGSLSNLFAQDLEDMPSPPQATQAPQAGAASSPAQASPQAQQQNGASAPTNTTKRATAWLDRLKDESDPKVAMMDRSQLDAIVADLDLAPGNVNALLGAPIAEFQERDPEQNTNLVTARMLLEAVQGARA